MDSLSSPPGPDGGSELRRRIEAIAAAAGPSAQPPSQPWIEALAARLEAGIAARLEAELASLRTDLADALEELSTGLQQRLAAIETAIEHQTRR